MRNKLLIFLLILIPGSVFSQNMDIRLLRSIFTRHQLQADPTMKFVSASNNFMVVGIPFSMGIAGFSRMYLGVHYPSDILGGMILGSGSAFLTFKLNKWLNQRYEAKYGHPKKWF